VSDAQPAFVGIHAVNKMGYTFSSVLARIYPTGNAAIGYDLSGASTTLANFETPLTDDQADSYFPQAMAALDANSTPAGNGASKMTPRKALIIVTDGI
jgi:hypothetical protein